MASFALLSQLQKLGLDHMSEKLTPIFHACIDMEGTVESHNDVFQEFTSYMDQHMAEYCANFEDEEGTWVPIELIKHIYQSDKNFRFRLSRLIKYLGSTHLREEDLDILADLDMGNIGTKLLRWDMTLALLIIEGTYKSKGKRKATPPKKNTPHLLIKEADPKEEFVVATQEAVLVLTFSAEEKPVEENLDQDIDTDEVMEEVADLELQTLHPILIDGVEF